MTAGFVLAIAAYGQVGLVGEGGEEVEEAGRFGLLHLSAELPLEGLPATGVAAGIESQGDQIGCRRECRQPDVVEVAFGEVRFGDAARRPADGA